MWFAMNVSSHTLTHNLLHNNWFNAIPINSIAVILVHSLYLGFGFFKRIGWFSSCRFAARSVSVLAAAASTTSNNFQFFCTSFSLAISQYPLLLLLMLLLLSFCFIVIEMSSPVAYIPGWLTNLYKHSHMHNKMNCFCGHIIFRNV